MTASNRCLALVTGAAKGLGLGIAACFAGSRTPVAARDRDAAALAAGTEEPR